MAKKKKRSARVAGDRVRELRAKAEAARQRRVDARKEAKAAKQRAKEARRLFKDARKIAKRAKAELDVVSRKLRKLLKGAPRQAARAVKRVAKARKKTVDPDV